MQSLTNFQHDIAVQAQPPHRHSSLPGVLSCFPLPFPTPSLDAPKTLIHSATQALLPWSQFSSVAQSCLTLCDPMNRSTPGLPVHHQLPEFTQTHAHRVSDAIQPSHPLSSPSLPAPNPSQHQGLFQ